MENEIEVLKQSKLNAVIEDETIIYGSFFLGNSEFALAVTSIQEVVNPPKKYSPMPLAPEHLLGIFNIRNMIIPVISLGRLLKISHNSENPDNQKIAIIEFEGSRLGLLFDQTGEIFRSRKESRIDFDYKESKNLEGNVVSSVMKLDDGKRIVQILDPKALFNLEGMPRPNPAAHLNSRASKSNQNEGGRHQCISFMVGPSQCAFGIDSISEIIKFNDIQKSALVGNSCLGIITLRGDVVPVIDFAQVLGYGPEITDEVPNEARRIIVLKLGNERFGLLVNSVKNIITYYMNEVLSIPVLAKEKESLFLGCLSKAEMGDVFLLDYRHVLSNAEILEITHGHSKIYQTSTSTEDVKKSRKLRKTYIAFKLNSLFGVGIDEVSEIIDSPESLLQTPGLPSHVKGLLNLRGQILPVVDAREVYAMELNPTEKSKKIMIFVRKGQKFGLIVDTVDSILSFSESERLKLPQDLLMKGNQSISNDIKEAVEVTGDGGTKKTLIILNLDPLAERVFAGHVA